MTYPSKNKQTFDTGNAIISVEIHENRRDNNPAVIAFVNECSIRCTSPHLTRPRTLFLKATLLLAETALDSEVMADMEDFIVGGTA